MSASKMTIDGKTGKVIPEGTPTQVAHPGKALVRFIVAAAVGVVLGWIARVIGLDLAEFSDVIIDWVTGVVVLVGGGLVQWLLTHKRLQGFWKVIGLDTGVDREKMIPLPADGPGERRAPYDPARDVPAD